MHILILKASPMYLKNETEENCILKMREISSSETGLNLFWKKMDFRLVPEQCVSKLFSSLIVWGSCLLL